MNHWIQVQSNVLTHRKTFALAESLKISRHEALGLMVNLWAWAAVNALDGDLTGFSPNSLKEAISYKKSGKTLIDGLLSAKLLEKREDGHLVIHNWERYATLLIDMEADRNQKAKERMQRHRAKRNRNATETAGCASTEPNPTEPNQTKQNKPSLSEEITPSSPPISCGGEDGDFGLAEQYLQKRGLKLSDYFGYQQVRDQVNQWARNGLRFWNRSPTPLDTVVFFFHGTDWDGEQRTVNPEKMDLILYALEQSVIAGKIGNWRYVEGVLTNLAYRDIHTVGDAEVFEQERR